MDFRWYAVITVITIISTIHLLHTYIHNITCLLMILKFSQLLNVSGTWRSIIIIIIIIIIITRQNVPHGLKRTYSFRCRRSRSASRADSCVGPSGTSKSLSTYNKIARRVVTVHARHDRRCNRRSDSFDNECRIAANTCRALNRGRKHCFSQLNARLYWGPWRPRNHIFASPPKVLQICSNEGFDSAAECH